MLKDSVNIEELIKKYSYPLYVYDKAIILNKINIIKQYFDDWIILYSIKANPFNKILDIVKKQRDRERLYSYTE